MADIPSFDEFKKTQPVQGGIPSFDEFKAKQADPVAGKPPVVPGLQGPPDSYAMQTLKAVPQSAANVLRSSFPPAMAMDQIKEGLHPDTTQKPLAGIKAIGSSLVRPYVHPIDSFKEDPVGTALAYAPLAKGIHAGIDAIPSMERAGTNFQTVMGAAKDVPVDVSKFAQPALRARELNANTGAPVPAVLRKALQFSGPSTNPLTYGDARDLASAAGRQSVAEKLATNPQMGAQVKRLAGGLADANQEAADSVGMGDLHKSAMTEYRRAAKLRDFKENAIDAAKSTAGKTALGVLGGGAAGYGVSKLLK